MKLALHTCPFLDCRTQNPILAAAHARSTEKTADIHVPFVQNLLSIINMPDSGHHGLDGAADLCRIYLENWIRPRGGLLGIQGCLHASTLADQARSAKPDGQHDPA